MGHRLEDVADVVERLEDLGLKLAIIGDTSILYAAGFRTFEGDLDLYAFEGSPSASLEALSRLAEELGWDLGSTSIGTPALVVRKGDSEILVELYEPIHDFYIPRELVEGSRIVAFDGHTLRILTPEQHIVLKAREGSEDSEEKLSKYFDLFEKGQLRINVQDLRRYASLFEEERAVIFRLRKAGFPV